MEPFATATDMQNRSQGEISTATHPYLAKELAAASRAIRNACRWHIAKIENLTFRQIRRYPFLCYLPAMQIQEITSARVNGIEIAPDLVEFDPETGQTNLYGRAIVVEYIAGFAEVPEDLELLTLELAAGALGVALGITRESAGSVMVGYARSGGGVTLADLDRLAPYRIGPLP